MITMQGPALLSNHVFIMIVNIIQGVNTLAELCPLVVRMNMMSK